MDIFKIWIQFWFGCKWHSGWHQPRKKHTILYNTGTLRAWYMYRFAPLLCNPFSWIICPCKHLTVMIFYHAHLHTEYIVISHLLEFHKSILIEDASQIKLRILEHEVANSVMLLTYTPTCIGSWLWTATNIVTMYVPFIYSHIPYLKSIHPLAAEIFVMNFFSIITKQEVYIKEQLNWLTTYDNILSHISHLNLTAAKFGDSNIPHTCWIYCGIKYRK